MDNKALENITNSKIENLSININCKKAVVVVGGSSGIGYHVAKIFSQKGITVYNLSRRSCDIDNVKNIICDVSNGVQLRQAFESITQPISVLIYSAGFSMAAPVEYAKEEDYKYLFEVNFFGMLKSVQYVLPKMKQSGGNIVVVSSIGGVVPIFFDSFYSASKAGVDMFVKACSYELKKYNICITSVQPGGTKTDFTFKRKVYPDSSVGDYAQDMKQAVSMLSAIEQRGMEAKKVAKIIYDVTQKSNPPLTITCGVTNKAIKTFDRVLPTKAVVGLFKSIYYN